MIKILLAVSLFFFAIINGFGQEYVIKGRIVLGQYLKPAGSVYVKFDTTNMVQSDSNGYFEITANEREIKDTLTIFLLTHNKVKITNLPKDSVTDLGMIPIYEYFYGVPFVHFDCGVLNFSCNRRRKKFWKIFEEERTAYFEKMNTIIGHYRLLLNGKSYAINTTNHLIDLNKPVEE